MLCSESGAASKGLCSSLLGRLDMSLWVQREQQELKEVDETLDRATEILQVCVFSITSVNYTAIRLIEERQNAFNYQAQSCCGRWIECVLYNVLLNHA